MGRSFGAPFEPMYCPVAEGILAMPVGPARFSSEVTLDFYSVLPRPAVESIGSIFLLLNIFSAGV